MSNSLQSRIVTINNVTYTPINTPLGVSGKSVVQQIYKNSVDGKYYILAEGGTPEELGGGGGGQVISGSLPTSGWTANTNNLLDSSFKTPRGISYVFIKNIGAVNINKTGWVCTFEGSYDRNGSLVSNSYIAFASGAFSGGIYAYLRLYPNGDIYGYSSNGSLTVNSIICTGGAKWLYSISDSAIKINSFAEMQLVSAAEVRTYSKTDGSIVVEMADVPTTAISYELQIIETDSESAFWIKNTYIPTIPTKTSELVNDSGFINNGFYYIDCSETAVDLDDYLSSNSVGIYILDKVTSNNVSNLPTEFEGINTIIMKLREFADGGHSQTIEWSYGTTEIIDYKYARTPQSTAWQRMRATADVLSITIPYANFVTIAGFEPFTKYCLVTVDTKYNAGAEYELIANTLITIFATYGIALYNVEQNPSDATKTDFYFLAITAPITDMQVTVKVNYSDSLDYDA